MIELLKLALPVIFTYLGNMLMGIVDIWFVGRINIEAIGAVGIGTSVFTWFLVFGMGVVGGMEYLVSHAHGANDVKRRHQYLIHGILLAIGVSIPLTLTMLLITLHLDWFGINAQVLTIAKDYTYVLSFSLIFSTLFTVFRVYLTAVGIAAPAMKILILANLLNAGLDYLFVLGGFGFHSFGTVGSAWATLISRVFTVIAILGYLWNWDRKNDRLFCLETFRIKLKVLVEMLRIGLPAAFQTLFEVGVFTLSTALAARLHPAELAAHQIVLNAASLTFMVPLATGSATAVLVAQALGRKLPHRAIQEGWRGFILGVGFMAFSCLFLLIFPSQVLGFFTHDPQVIAMGKRIFVIAALFQLADGVQTVGTGVLRGFGDTHSPMLYNFCGHWLIGLPLGIYLCFSVQMGLPGLWIGLSIGLIVVAILVFYRWRARIAELLKANSV